MARTLPRIGIVVPARPQFDTVFAQEILDKALETLKAVDAEFVGSTAMLYDVAALKEALPALEAAAPDLLLVLQVTFTDATMTVELAKAIDRPILMWSYPEPRTGGRLRLNSFCGVNLASHALSRMGRPIDYVHSAPDDPAAAAKIAVAAKAAMVARDLAGTRLLLVGEHPAGFQPCDFEDADLARIFGITVDREPVIDFIDTVKAAPEEVADAPLARRRRDFANLDELDPVATKKTMKVYAGLHQRACDKGYAGIAVRCWPDFFVEYGCSACGALAMLNEDRVPAGCEADMYGVVTSLILQRASGEAVFNTDLVDVDAADDTVVFWHCGQAPLDMADPEFQPRGTIHSNRKMPLLSEFPLKPGRFTLARLTRGGGTLRLMLGAGEMLRRPLAFSGTAGVARLDVPAATFLDTILTEGLEHHSAIAYGEHRPVMRAIAARLGIPVVEMT
jgi:L-fucose isomerase-like protein